MGNYLCCCGCCKKKKTDNNNNNAQQKRNRKVKVKLTPYEQELFDEEVDKPVKPITDSSIKIDELIFQYDIPKDDSHNEIIESRGYRIRYELVISKDSKVYRAVNVKTNKTVACKLYDIPEEEKKKQRYMKAIANEVFVSIQLKHPHVIQYYDYFTINNSCYIFMNFASAGNLNSFIKTYGPIDEKQCKTWFAQIVSAIYYMHMNCISHNDIKPDNIVIDSKHRVFITDFGLSRVSYCFDKNGTQLSTKFCGTKQYLAPEIIMIEANKVLPDYVKLAYNPFQADVWALGVTLYQMYTKKYPYAHGLAYTELLKYSLQYRSLLRFRLKAINRKTNRLLLEILSDMFISDWKTRITISELVSHQWFNNEAIDIVHTVNKG